MVVIEVLIVLVGFPLLALTIVGIVKSRKLAYKTISIISCVVVSVLILCGAGIAAEFEGVETSADESEVTEPSTKYSVHSVSELVADLEANALNAKEKYEGEYVEITGRVDVIDASGQYICLYPEDNEWILIDVQCFIKNKEQKEFVKSIKTGDVVTIRGKITSVGEIMGYSLNIHEFVK